MKKLFNTLSTVVCILGLSLNAQTNKPAASNNTQVDMSDTKSKYIQNQDYLSKSTQKDFSSYYGDSLKGFKEEAVKAELLSHNYVGTEYTSMLDFRKREFINNKYKIGPDFIKKPKAVTPTPPPFTPKIIGGLNVVSALPCINEDFEQTPPGTYLNNASAVTGWTITSTSSQGKNLSCGTPSNFAWTGGSPEFSIVSTPILNHPYIGNIPNSPLGGSNVAVLNNTITPTYVVTRLSTTFPVTAANTVFQFAYAGSWDGSGHSCCDQPFFNIDMFNCQGAPLGCSSLSLTPPGPSCNNGATGYSVTGGVSWTNWQVKYIDLTPYVGSCVTLQITNGDCNAGGHHGSLYFDAKCGGSVLCGNCTPPGGSVTVIPGPVSFCSGSGQAQISAPVGYATYSWTAPFGAPVITAAQATLAALTITNPIVGSVYTVNLVSPSGCLFTSTNAIVFTSVAISGIATDPSCMGGASGQATVVGWGSGSGYNYTWYNSNNVTVGTTSIITGLAAGIYSVVVSGLGAAGCGSAIATTTVGSVAPGVINYTKPYCGASAYIITPGGTNFQWYNNTTAIPAAQGGNSATLTIPSPGISGPATGQIVILTYLSNLGCQDSVKYTLTATPPGNVVPFNIKQVCSGGSNATAVLTITPAQGAPPGVASILVGPLNAQTPPYSYASGPNSIFSHSIGGLSAGTYTVKASDGSCNYTSQFSVTTHTFNYNVAPTTSLICPGTMVQASATFTNNIAVGQYNFSWSPTTFVVGANQANAFITPIVPVGTQNAFIYSITVTPTVINCPLVKTITITAVNPAIPTITAIPDKCDVSAPFQIIANPPGGTFVNTVGGVNNPLTLGGFVTPTFAIIGAPNTFTYTHAVSGCSASTSGSFNVSKFWTAALSSNVPPLCVTNAPFNLMNIVQNTQNGTWTGPTNGGFPTVFAGQFSPAGLPTGAYTVTYSTLSTPNPTVCPSFSTHIISVTHTSVPSIVGVAEFCTNQPTFNMVVSPSGGGWIPVTGLSPAGVVNPVNFPQGVNSQVATYTVMDGPCLNINSTTLNISHFNPASFSGTINPLCFNSPTVNLMSIAQNTNGVWSGMGVINNSLFPQTFLTTTVVPLTYTVFSTPNPNLCKDIKTINVSVLVPKIPSITQVGPFCNNGASVQLTVTPNTGQWTTSAYLNNTGIFDPTQTSIGNNPVEYVVGTSTCHVEKTIFVNIEAFVPATILSTVPDLCNNSPSIDLSPFTLSNQGTWSGSGISGANFNPAATGSGNFVLSHHTSSYPSGMCPDVASIAVNVYSLAAPVITPEQPICNNTKPFKLKVSPVGGFFGGSAPGTVDLDGLFNPGSALIGNNVINYSITSGPCTAYAQTTVKIEKFVAASFAKAAGPFCNGDEAFNMNSIVTNQGGKWRETQGLLGNMFYPTLAPKTAITLTYTTWSSDANPLLCPDQGTITVVVRETPTVSTNHVDGGCAPVTAPFNVKDKNTGTGVWNFGDGSEPVVGLVADHIFTKPGKYNVQFDYVDELGCKAAPYYPKPVIVNELPKADFSIPEEVYISDPQVQLTNQSNVLSDNKYQWKIAGLPGSSDINYNVTFPKIGKYQVTLTATSINDCKDEITKTIEVKNNFNVFIPNSFSPNFDGLNDFFVPVFTKEGLDLKSFEMEIFDRWGHSLYRTKDITKGWDGSVQNKGEPLKEEVYVFRIKYKDMEGNLYNKMGNVTLLK